MGPLYAQCPRCEFPVVVAAPDRRAQRRCRQCGGQFIPDPPGGEDDYDELMRARKARGRAGIRALLKRARRIV